MQNDIKTFTELLFNFPYELSSCGSHKGGGGMLEGDCEGVATEAGNV